MAESGARILLVDDEEAILKLLRSAPEKEGYQVVTARDGDEALETFTREDFDLVILDIMLPHVDGMEVCRRNHAQNIVSIIMLTAESDEFDKVLGLEIGADDYITKDKFSLREFRSRVRASSRRADEPQRGGDDVGRHQERSSRGGRPQAQRHRARRQGPFHLHRVRDPQDAHLAPGPGLQSSVAAPAGVGDSDYRDSRTVDVHIRHLREKLEADPNVPSSSSRSATSATSSVEF